MRVTSCRMFCVFSQSYLSLKAQILFKMSVVVLQNSYVYCVHLEYQYFENYWEPLLFLQSTWPKFAHLRYLFFIKQKYVCFFSYML